MTDVGIRAGADAPVETKAAIVECMQLEKPCAHALVVWRIGRERWHQVRVDNGHPMLEPCKS